MPFPTDRNERAKAASSRQRANGRGPRNIRRRKNGFHIQNDQRDTRERGQFCSCGLTAGSDHPGRKREMCHITYVIDASRLYVKLGINPSRRMNVHLNVQRSGVPGLTHSGSEFRQRELRRSVLFGRIASVKIVANGERGQELDRGIDRSPRSCPFWQVPSPFLFCKGATAAVEPNQGSTFNSRVIFSAIISCPFDRRRRNMPFEIYRKFQFPGEAAFNLFGADH